MQSERSRNLLISFVYVIHVKKKINLFMHSSTMEHPY